MAPKHRLYTPEIAETILERLADGEGLTTICRDEGMPSRGAVRCWIEADHEAFAARYAQARARGVELLADDILDVSDNATNDWMRRNDPENPGYRENGEAVQRSRLRVDSRKWLLSKLIPKTYGDKIDVTGELNVKDLSDEDVKSRLAEFVRKAGMAVALSGGRDTGNEEGDTGGT